MKQRAGIEELQQGRCVLCGSHRDEKNTFFFVPKTLAALHIKSSDCMESFSHPTRARQEPGNISRFLCSYGMNTI